MPKLSKTVVDAAHPKDRRYYLWDSNLRGFGLLVLPSGVKTYLMTYRTPDGRQRRATIGRHGDMTPDKARKAAEDMRDVIRKGGDPVGSKRAAREAMTVAELTDLYLASDAFKEKAAATQYNDQGRIRRHILPLLGRLPAALVTTADVRKARNAIRDGKTATREKTKPRGLARVRGGESAAIDTITLLRTIYNWAISDEGGKLLTENPVAALKLGQHGTRDTILEESGDYQRMFEAIASLEQAGKLRSEPAEIIRLLALTGARKSEIAKLRWKHVDLKRGQVILPPAAHKTGKKTGKPRIIGLNAAAQAIIARQPAGEPDALIFPPSRSGKALDLTRPWYMVRKEAKLPEGIGLHGLRHSHGSHFAMAGGTEFQVMQVLGHRQASTAMRYVHFAEAARLSLAERAAATAIAGMEAAAGAQKASVTPIKPGRRT